MGEGVHRSELCGSLLLCVVVPCGWPVLYEGGEMRAGGAELSRWGFSNRVATTCSLGPCLAWATLAHRVMCGLPGWSSRNLLRVWCGMVRKVCQRNSMMSFSTWGSLPVGWYRWYVGE